MGDKTSTANGCLTWDQQADEWNRWLSDIMSQPHPATTATKEAD